MRRGRLAVALALLASTLSVTVATTPAHAEAPALPPAPTPEGRPWSGTISVTKDFTTQDGNSMRYVYVEVTGDSAQDDYLGATAPTWSCTGTENVRMTTTGDGVEDEYDNASVPALAEISAQESCLGTYEIWKEYPTPPDVCNASATWATSGSVEGAISFGWSLYDFTDPSQGGSWGFDGFSLDHPPIQMSLTDPCGYLDFGHSDPYWLMWVHGNQEGPGIPPASRTIGNQMSGSYVYDFGRPQGGGTSEGNDEVWTIDYDFVYTGPPPDLCLGGPATPTDADGDRLPDTYENQISGTDPAKADTDGDCFRDAREVASGSSPLNMAQTPDTLPSGVAPTNLVGRGHAGITCGNTLFRWVTPSLQGLGVDKGRKGCIMLLSNSAANAVLDYSIQYGTNVTTTLMRMTRPQLLELNGQPSIDWFQEANVHANIWGTKTVVKKMMLQSMNLTRLNAVFTVARLAALSGVPYGALWGVNQVRNKNACIQIRLGNSADGTSRLSWSLVYSVENLTNEGFNDDLHRAGVWKKKARRYLPDTAIRKSTNLICKYGRPVATGGGAGEVFEGPASYIF